MKRPIFLFSLAAMSLAIGCVPVPAAQFPEYFTEEEARSYNISSDFPEEEPLRQTDMDMLDQIPWLSDTELTKLSDLSEKALLLMGFEKVMVDDGEQILTGDVFLCEREDCMVPLIFLSENRYADLERNTAVYKEELPEIVFRKTEGYETQAGSGESAEETTDNRPAEETVSETDTGKSMSDGDYEKEENTEANSEDEAQKADAPVQEITLVSNKAVRMISRQETAKVPCIHIKAGRQASV